MGIELLITIPIVVGLTEATKRIFPSIPSRYFPLVALWWAIGGALLSFTAFAPLVIEVLIIALSAAGLYSGSKAVLDK